MDDNETAIWSLLVASGYLKIMGYERLTAFGFGQKVKYELKLTNGEVNYMFYNMIRGWFEKASTPYNEFIKAMLCNNLKEMNIYMNRVARDTFSYFDTGKRPSEETDLEETVQSALAQIEDRQYEAVLLDKGFQKEQIYKYGFAFEGKKILIGQRKQ